MKTLLTNWCGRGAAFYLPLMMVLGFLAPGNAHAIKEIRNGHGGDDGEGDPIDGNDYGSGGGGDTDDFLHNGLGGSSSAGFWFMPIIGDGTRILLLPDFQSGVVSFQIIIFEKAWSPPEAFDEE